MAGESLNDKQHAAYTAHAGEMPAGAVRVVGEVSTTGGSSSSPSVQPVSVTSGFPIVQPVSITSGFPVVQPVSITSGFPVTQPISVANGSDITQGSTDDAALVTDTNGTVSGKLRGLVKIFADVWDSGNRWIKVSIVTGQLTASTYATGAISTGFNPIGSLTTGTAQLGTVTANPATYYGKTITYVTVAQGAAGTTILAAANATKKHKVIGGMLTMSLAGTLKFNDGVVDLTGPMTFAANGGMVVPESPVPFVETGAINRDLNLITTVGAANGVIAILTEA